MKKGVKKIKKQIVRNEKNKVYWVSITSFIFSILGWICYTFNNTILAGSGLILLCIAPILGVFGLARLSPEKNPQMRRLNATLSWIAIIISSLFLSCLLIGLTFR